MTASLDLDAVYAAICEQAVLLSNAPTALLLRLDSATQTLRCVASTGASERLVSHRYALGEGMIGAVAAGGEPYVSRAEDRQPASCRGSRTRASARSPTSRSGSARGASAC